MYKFIPVAPRRCGRRHLKRVRADIDVHPLFGVARYERRSKTEIKFSCHAFSSVSKHSQNVVSVKETISFRVSVHQTIET